MKFDRYIKPELLCADETRAMISQCYIQEGERKGIDIAFPDKLEAGERPGTIVATNGRALVAVAVILEAGDVPGYITTPALQYARKLAFYGVNMKANGGFARLKIYRKCVRHVDGVIMPGSKLNGCATYPNWENLIAEDPGALVPRCFSPLLLMDISTALGLRPANPYSSGARGLLLSTPDAVSMITCRVQNKKDRLGLLMPMREMEERRDND